MTHAVEYGLLVQEELAKEAEILAIKLESPKSALSNGMSMREKGRTHPGIFSGAIDLPNVEAVLGVDSAAWRTREGAAPLGFE